MFCPVAPAEHCAPLDQGWRKYDHMLRHTAKAGSSGSITAGTCESSPDNKASALDNKASALRGGIVKSCPDHNAGRTGVPRYRMKQPSIAQRVENWILYNSRNECICDLCIAKEIGVNDSRKVAIVTQKLAVRDPPFFIRWRGQCSSCGKPKSVILARRLTWA